MQNSPGGRGWISGSWRRGTSATILARGGRGQGRELLVRTG